jgi:hypothetical protein
LVAAAEYYSPFLGIEKGAVLQEARVFHDPQLDARRCCQVPVCLVVFHHPTNGISRYNLSKLVRM